MSPEAIENRLKLVGELTRACLMLRRNVLKITELQAMASERNLNSTQQDSQTKRLFAVRLDEFRETTGAPR